ncbi:hypothetical protein JW777_10005 [bacterium]|nr:hypothetical protein [bacterium]
MRFRSGIKLIWSGFRMLFMPAPSLLAELCVQRIRESIRKDTMVMPDFTVWTNRNHLDVYLSRDDLFKLGGLERELGSRLEKAAADVCREDGIRNPYGRIELSLRSHPELRTGEVFVDARIDAAIPRLPAERSGEQPMQFRTIFMKEPIMDRTDPMAAGNPDDRR